MKKKNNMDDIFIVVYNKNTNKIQFVRRLWMSGHDVEDMLEITSDQRDALVITADNVQDYVDHYYKYLTQYQEKHPDTEFLYVAMKGLFRHER